MGERIGNYVYSTKPIGKGSFAQVYKGFDIETDKMVAIKIIDISELDDKLRSRSKDEITLLQKLDHPNIIKLFDFIETEEVWYVVLEYSGEGDLYELLKKKYNILEEEEAQGYISQLAQGLKYLRQKNISHRDLKPHNILLKEGVIKIIDFNFARTLEDNDMAMTLCGSPLYMAPEILGRNNYTSKSDLWSVGIILYEMVYGINPFKDITNVLDLCSVIKTRKIGFDHFGISVSDECIDIMKGLLRKDPVYRIGWNAFFEHEWILNNPSQYHVRKNLHSHSHSHCMSTSSIPIRENKYRIIHDYEPQSSNSLKLKQNTPITPPSIIRSEPIAMTKLTPTQSLWDTLSSSTHSIKNAFEYISTQSFIN